MKFLFILFFLAGGPALAATCNQVLITPPFSLHTPRLELNFLTQDDATEMQQIHLAPEIARRNLGERDVARIQQEIDQNGRVAENVFVFSLGIFLEQKMIGIVSFYMMNTNQPVGTIGYVLLPEYWGQGFAREAVVELINFAKEKLPIQLTTLEAHVDRTNRRSIRLLRRLGFQYSRDSARRELIFTRAI